MEKIGTRVGARDFRGRPPTIEKKIVFSRLKRYQKKYQWNKERTELMQELERLRSVMGIPRPCVEQALEIYRQALEKEISGMSTEAMAAAALYMACRMMKMPRPLDELVRYTKASKKKVARCYRLLLQELNVKVPVSDPMLYVSRIAGQLKLSGEVVKTAIEILQKAKKARITAGKDPAGLAATALYIASIMHGENIPQKQFAIAAGVAVITLREQHMTLMKIMEKKLSGFEKEVEVDGKTCIVKVLNGGADVEESQSGKKLLRIKIAAEVDGVRLDYTFTFGKYNSRILCYIVPKATPDGREAEAVRLLALIKALTGKEPKIRRRSDKKIEMLCSKRHLEGFRRFAELADAVERWLRR